MREREKTRDSNIELLRILAMFMIISHHLVVHCIQAQFTDLISLYDFRFVDNPYAFDQLWKKHFILSVFKFFGPVSNAIFILISGYFLAAKWQNTISYSRLINVSKKLLSQTAFAAFVVALSSTVVFFSKPELNTSTLSIISLFNTMSWFVGYYLLVIVSGEVILNRFLVSLSKEKYLAFLLILFSFISFHWSGTLFESFASGFRVYLTGVFLFSLGGFIRIYNPFLKIRTISIFALIALIFSFIFLSSKSLVFKQVNSYLANYNINSLSFSYTSFENFNIWVILFSVSLFEIFRRVNVPCVKAINFVSSATFIVYLIHDNKFFYSIWDTQNWAELFMENLTGFMLKFGLWALLIFFIGILCYVLFLGVKLFFKKCSWLFIRN